MTRKILRRDYKPSHTTTTTTTMTRFTLRLAHLQLLVVLTVIVGGLLHTYSVVYNLDTADNLSNTGGGFRENVGYYTDYISTNSSVDLNRIFKDKRIQQFKMITETVDVCKPQKNIQIDLFIFIFSRCGDFSLRNTLRKTWLSSFLGNKSSVRYVFLLATNTSGLILNDITREIRHFKDVIMYDVIDSYQNLTLKTMLGMQFATNFCGSAKNVMKTDSDVYVNLPALLQKLKTTHESTALGLLHVNATPIRNRTGETRKWFVSTEEFPDSVYPAYFDGMGYVFPMSIVQNLVKVFPVVPFFKFEDVYIGMCLKRIGYRLQLTTGFFRSESILTICSHKAKTVYAVHGMAENLINAIWRLNCTGMVNAVVRKPTRVMYKWIKV